MATQVPRSNLSELSGKLVLLQILLAPIFITPWWNFDPINLPRLLLLASITLPLTVIGLFNLRGNLLFAITKSERAFIFLLATFLIMSTFSLFLSKANITIQLYGVQGRNTGYIAFFLLLSLIFGIYFGAPKINDKHLLLVIFFGGIINLIYGGFQSFGVDSINWENPYGPVVGALGNPNFVSSFLGMYGTFLTSLLLWRKSNSVVIMLGLFLLLVANTFVISKTDSIQGYFVLGIGIAALLLLKIRLNIVKAFALGFTFIIAMVIGLLGVAGSGPLSEMLYQNTLQVRIFFWEAAWKLISERPLIGYGWDTFGNWYKTARSLESTQPYGLGLTTNSAHNLFLDVGVSGGLICMISLLITSVLITLRGISFKFKVSDTNWKFSVSFAIWMGFLAQSLISVNSLAITIWGFSFGGLALHFTRNTIEPEYSHKKSVTRKSVSLKKAGVLFCLILGFLITFPALYSDHKFRVALGESRGDLILQAANRFPTNDFRLLVAANIFYRNNLNESARELVRKSLVLNPRSTSALNLLLQDQELSKREKDIIKSEIKKIDIFAKLE